MQRWHFKSWNPTNHSSFPEKFLIFRQFHFAGLVAMKLRWVYVWEMKAPSGEHKASCPLFPQKEIKERLRAPAWNRDLLLPLNGSGAESSDLTTCPAPSCNFKMRHNCHFCPLIYLRAVSQLQAGDSPRAAGGKQSGKHGWKHGWKHGSRRGG